MAQRNSQAKGSTGKHQDTLKTALINLSQLEYCRAWSNNTGVGRDLKSERIIRFGLKGSSDIIGIYKGRFLAVEIKTGNAVQSDQQKKFQKMVCKLGGIYVVIRDTNVEQINMIVEQGYGALV